jgi:ribosome-associated translation inhibitor RaiA
VSMREEYDGSRGESGNVTLEVPPGSPDWHAHVTHISGLAEQFSDLVEDMFQRGEAQNIGEHGQTLSLKRVCVEFHGLSGCSPKFKLTRGRIADDIAGNEWGCYAFGDVDRRADPRAPRRPPSECRTGASMKLSISYKHVEGQKPVEAEVERHVGKLGKLLQSYSPDLVQLHGSFAKNLRTDEYSCTLNLSLPTGTLHAIGSGANVRASCKKAFSELEAQVKKHQAKLRKDYEWKRKRPRVSDEVFS